LTSLTVPPALLAVLPNLLAPARALFHRFTAKKWARKVSLKPEIRSILWTSLCVTRSCPGDSRMKTKRMKTDEKRAQGPRLEFLSLATAVLR
jgi:hypothetical protein